MEDKETRTKEIATLEAKGDLVGAMLMRSLPGIQKNLPAVMKKNAERFMRVALTTIRRSSMLQQCTPVSIGASVMEAASLNLELDSRGLAYLVPYKNKGVYEAQLQVGYKGLVALATRSGNFSHITSDVIYRPEYEQGMVEIDQGTGRTLIHRRDPIRPELRCSDMAPALADKEIVGAYTVMTFKSGIRDFYFIDRAHIDKRMNSSQMVKNAKRYNKPLSDSCPWKAWFAEMCMKTSVKAAMKGISISADVGHAMSLDDQAEAGERQTYRTEVVPTPEPKSGALAADQAVQDPEYVEAEVVDEGEPATDAQVFWLNNYYKGWEEDRAMQHIGGFFQMGSMGPSDLTFDQASGLIEALQNG